MICLLKNSGTNYLWVYHQNQASRHVPLLARMILFLGFPGGASVKEPTCQAGDPGSIPGLRRPPGGGRGNPLQDSCLENPTDRGAQRATALGVSKSQT